MIGLTTRTRIALLAALLSLAGGCWRRAAQTSGPRWLENGRTARELPVMFLADTTNRASRTVPDEACTVRLRDPRDTSTRLLLVRSQQVGGDVTPNTARTSTTDIVPNQQPRHRDFRGDYAVDPPGRYGVGAGELLRLDCISGRALGIVSGSR
jgi:hypothetical protein